MHEAMDEDTRAIWANEASSKPRRSCPRAVPPRGEMTNTEDRETGWLSYIAFVILAIGAFFLMIRSDLLWTEHETVQRTSFHELSSWSQSWQVNSIQNDDPLALTSYFIEKDLPLPPVSTYRLVNICLHLFAAILLLKTLESLRIPVAFATAALFASYSAAVQILFWPGYRTELIAAMLILGASYFTTTNRSSRNFVLMCALSATAFLIHAGILVLPLVIAAMILLQSHVIRIEEFNRVLPVFSMALFIGIWTATGTQPKTSQTQREINAVSLMSQNLFFHLKQTFVPIYQALFYLFRAKQGYNLGVSNNLLHFILFIPFYALAIFNFNKAWARGMILGISAFLLSIIYWLGQSGLFIDGSCTHGT